MEVSYKEKQKIQRQLLKELYQLGKVKEKDQVFLPHSTSPDYPTAYYALHNTYIKSDKKEHEKRMLKELYKLGKVKEQDRLFMPKKESPDYHKIYSVLRRPSINAQIRLYRYKTGLVKNPKDL